MSLAWATSPSYLMEDFVKNIDKNSPEDLDYWLRIWINYYDYLLQHFDEDLMVVAFEDLIEDPNKVYAHIKNNLSIEAVLSSDKKHVPTQYKKVSCDPALKEKAMDIYNQLNTLKGY